VRLVREIGKRLVNMGHEVSVYTTDSLDNNSFMSLRKARRSGRLGMWHDGTLRVHSFRPLVLPYLQQKLPVFTFGPLIPQSLPVFLSQERDTQIVHSMAFPYAHNGFAYFACKIGPGNKKLILSPWLKERSNIPFYLRRVLRRADALIAQSETEKRRLAKIAAHSCPIFNLPAGVGPEFGLNSSEAASLRARLGVGEDDKLLLFAGRMTREKGFPDVLSALELLPSDFKLMIVGRTNPRSQELLGEIRRRLPRRILVLGYVRDADLPTIFSAADLVVYPSADDSFGMVFLEAMRTGKAVIGCPIGGPRELLRKGWDSETTPFGKPATLASKIQQLFLSRKRLKKMGARGRLRARRLYDWDRIAKKLLAIYEHVLTR